MTSLSQEEYAALDKITGEGGNKADLHELEVGRRALYRKSVDPATPPWEQESCRNLLHVLDARWGVKKLDEERKRLSWWQRFLESFR